MTKSHQFRESMTSDQIITDTELVIERKRLIEQSDKLNLAIQRLLEERQKVGDTLVGNSGIYTSMHNRIRFNEIKAELKRKSDEINEIGKRLSEINKILGGEHKKDKKSIGICPTL